MTLAGVEALMFDVFGTVVDWRGSVTRELEAFGRARGLSLDWVEFADAWRGLYQPSMEEVRSGRRPWVSLDALHRESLVTLLQRHRIGGLTEGEIDHLNRAWHRLDPWPDVVSGLKRLKTRFLLATQSNGNVRLMADMARRAGLPWDAILGAEVAQGYKPEPKVYLTTARMLDAAPAACAMVAAHNDDLRVAAALGFRTCFVRRPLEFGPDRAAATQPKDGFDIVAEDFLDLARQLGC